MTLQAINDVCIVKLVDISQPTNTSIILTAAEPPCTGVIMSVGPGKVLNNGTREDHNLKEGDIIVFGKSSLNQPLEYEDEKYYVMRTGDIFGKKNG